MSEPETTERLQAELAELRAYKARSEQHAAEESQRRKHEAYRGLRAGAAAFCAGQVDAGRLTPHLRDRLLRELDRQAHAFSEGEPLRVSFEWVQAFIREQAPVLPAGEVGRGRERSAEVDEEPSRALARRAANTMAELNLGYSEAAAYVLRTDPALARAYREYTLNPTLGA